MAEGSMNKLDALSALAERLIPLRAPWGQMREPTVVSPAALPPELSDEVPLPAGSRLIGSCTSGTYSLTLVDAEQTPQGVLRFYEQELGARGWYRQQVYGSSGFLPTGERAAAWALFCRSPQGPSLRVGATPRWQSGSELQLLLETGSEFTPCASPSGIRLPRTQDPLRSSPLPMLEAPPGAAMQSFGSGGGGGSYQAHADFQSDLDFGQMAAHFRRLLVEAGWTEQRAGETGPVMWSRWICRNETGEELEGFFLGFRQGQRQYSLQLDREAAPGSRKKAEIETRRRARELEEAAKRDVARRVEIEAPVTPGANEALHELILRVVEPVDPHSPDAAEPRLVVGQMPDDMAVELPPPPGSPVLGGLELGGRTTIYLESESLPRQIVAFYRTHLSAPSWDFLGEKTDLGGFAASGALEAVTVQFCPTGDGPAISISAHSRSRGRTDVEIQVETDLRQTACGGNPNAPPASQYGNRQPALPVLVAPPESDFEFGGAHGGGMNWEAKGYLYTGAGLDDVADHYGRQFESAGWEKRDSGGDEVVAWSEWGRQDEWGERVDAIFLAVRHPGGGYSLVACATHLVKRDPVGWRQAPRP